ncbi:MAG TPA: FeoB-associated Cys-rich membrane protein [Lentisphaeria bacterium]|nr:FeoB-associated Cys-rich membrane protein [Lentisphaeria bacterium]
MGYIITALIVICAFIYIIRIALKTINGKRSCSCSGCPSKSCPSNKPEK